MADEFPEFECKIAALLTIASAGEGGLTATLAVNRYVEILAALREAGGPLAATKTKVEHNKRR